MKCAAYGYAHVSNMVQNSRLFTDKRFKREMPHMVLGSCFYYAFASKLIQFHFLFVALGSTEKSQRARHCVQTPHSGVWQDQS